MLVFPPKSSEEALDDVLEALPLRTVLLLLVIATVAAIGHAFTPKRWAL